MRVAARDRGSELLAVASYDGGRRRSPAPRVAGGPALAALPLPYGVPVAGGAATRKL